jgi:hypothetical protein
MWPCGDERLSAIGVGAVRLGRKEEIRECSRRGAARNGGQRGTFGRIPVPHRHPAPQPAFEGGKIWPTCRRRALPARGCTVAIRSDAPHPVKQSKVRLLLGQEGEKLPECGQDGEPCIPAIAVPGTERVGCEPNRCVKGDISP